jgi:hypothetical protein
LPRSDRGTSAGRSPPRQAMNGISSGGIVTKGRIHVSVFARGCGSGTCTAHCADCRRTTRRPRSVRRSEPRASRSRYRPCRAA